MADVEERIDAGRDAAQQAVTAALHGDRDIASDIVREHPDLLTLALVLVDLVAYVHTSWAWATGMSMESRNESWAELMADVEEWRHA